MYSALDIAKYIIVYCNTIGSAISNLKLQKVLYFVQAEFLVTIDTACFKEKIEAWALGPVVPVVYQKYKVFGSSIIPNISVGFFDRRIIQRDHRRLIEGVVDACKDFSASELVSLTHSQSPWLDVYVKGKNNVIKKSAIRKFFSKEEKNGNKH